jgi:hypothetical protein
LDGERKTSARSAVAAREGREQPSHQKIQESAFGIFAGVIP